MKIQPVNINDLNEIVKLQPEGWEDIGSHFQFYIKSTFCKPYKYVINKTIAGIGAVIFYKNTAWLAHIIVRPENRNKGIGKLIVKHLTDDVKKTGCSSILLIATDLGEPVYLKSGFRIVSNYLVFKREEQIKKINIDPHVVSFINEYADDILKTDLEITGEDRSNLIFPVLKSAGLYVKKNKILGYYIPQLNEGPVISKTSEAGISLMNYKYSAATKVVLPEQNKTGIDYLKNAGFIETSRLKRMILGNDIAWKPEFIYSRIGGNFG